MLSFSALLVTHSSGRVISPAAMACRIPSPTLSSEPYISAQSMCRTPAAMALRMAATSAGLTSVFGTPVR